MIQTRLKVKGEEISPLLASFEKTKSKEKTFEEMTDSEKRVAIAKDVIMQTNAGKYKFRMRGFLAFSNSGGGEINVKDIVQKEETTCHVCAKGALFVSAFLKDENAADLRYPEEGMYRTEIEDVLRETFSDSQMDLIEAAFEGSYIYGHRRGCNTAELSVQAARMYGWKESRQNKLISIMENIIKNNGEFVVS